MDAMDLDVSDDRLVIDLNENASSASAAMVETGDTPKRVQSEPPTESPNRTATIDAADLKMTIKRKKSRSSSLQDNKQQSVVHSDDGQTPTSSQKTDEIPLELQRQTVNGQPKAKKRKTASESRKAKCPIAQEKLGRRDASTWVRTIASSTDPDALGPCEPGTHVTLEGVVWNETPAGVLVVNVTWRGKSYVGTLLDCTRHDWAPPRICSSPLLELDRTPGKGRNGKRNRSSMCHSASTSDLSALNKNKKKASRAVPLSVVIPAAPATQSDEDSQPIPPVRLRPASETILEPISPVLRPCPCDHCHKRFIEPVALKFHQTAAHRCSDSPPSPDDILVNGDEVCKTLTNAETQSLQELFKVVDKTRSSTDLPKLEAPVQSETDRSVRTPGAYSDISDDGAAPVLEKEVAEKNGLTPKKSDKPLIDASPPVTISSITTTTTSTLAEVNAITTADETNSPSSTCTPKIYAVDGPVRPPSNGPARSLNNAPAKPLSDGPARPPSNESARSPSNVPVRPPSNGPRVSKGSNLLASTGTFIQAVGPAVPGPMLPPAGLFVPPTSSAFLRPLPGFAHPHGLFIPPGPPVSLASSTASTKHKIHELAAKGLPAPTPRSSTQLQMSTGLGKGGEMLSAAGVASPPVQRHLHMHQHTHSFPLFQPPIDPYTSSPYAMFNPHATPVNLAFPPK